MPRRRPDVRGALHQAAAHAVDAARQRARSHPSLVLVKRLMTSRVLPSSARLALLSATARAAAGGVTRDLAVPMPGGPLFVGPPSPSIDVTTVLDVWNGDMFPARCEGRVVLDVGAHKGYFGAWALWQGATAVLSFEPQADNHRSLERARAGNARRADWDVRNAAVGGAAGRATLYVSAESWAHSLLEHMVDAEGSEQVDVVPLSDVLDEVESRHPHRDVVLKLNIEGAAGAVLFALEPARLTPVVEVHLDHEPGSPHGLQDIVSHLASAGLTEVTSHDDRLFRFRRPVPPPLDRSG